MIKIKFFQAHELADLAIAVAAIEFSILTMNPVNRDRSPPVKFVASDRLLQPMVGLAYGCSVG